MKKKIPAHTLEALEAYVNHGCPPGGFVSAVLQNDLMNAFSLADSANQAAMKEIVEYLYNHVPVAAIGHPANIKRWIALGGREGVKK